MSVRSGYTGRCCTGWTGTGIEKGNERRVAVEAGKGVIRSLVFYTGG